MAATSRTQFRPEARFVLFKQSVITAHGSHFAGGKHAFLCMANTLAAEGFDVHLVSIASKEKVLVHAGMAGLLPMLSFVKPGVVTWREQQVHHHVLIVDESARHESVSCASLALAVSRYVQNLVPLSTLGEHQSGHGRAITAKVTPQAAEGQQIHSRDNEYGCGHGSRNKGNGMNDPGSEGVVGVGANNGSCHGGGGQRSTCNSRVLLDRDCRNNNRDRVIQGTWVIVDADESQKLLQLDSPPIQNRSLPLPGCGPRPSSDDTGVSNDATQIRIDSDSAQNCDTSHTDHDAGDHVTISEATPVTLFESLVAAVPPRRCLAYVQNVHFLPMGPSGTGPRYSGLSRAWNSLGSVLAVSEFIACYVRQNWTPCLAVATGALVPPPPVRVLPLATWRVFGRAPFPDLSREARPRLQAWRLAQHRRADSDLGPTLTAQTPQLGLEEPAVTAQLVPLEVSDQIATNQPSGSTATTARVISTTLPPPPSPPTNAQTEMNPEIRQPVDVAVLKLTPEKGASVIVELARRLAGRVRFRVVSGDPAAAAALAPLMCPRPGPSGPCRTGSTDSTSGTSNKGTDSIQIRSAAADAPPPPLAPRAVEVLAPSPVAQADVPAAAAAALIELWEPQPDVSRVLAGCVAVLAPSLWLEAWGMVVTEALLRGIPALVSDLGGLPEAGMRLCPTVPAEPIRIPPDGAGVPDWTARTYPKQDIDAWEHALLSLLLDGTDGGPLKAGDVDKNCGGGSWHESEEGDRPGEEGQGVGWDDGGAGVWERLSREGRRRALEYVQHADEFLGEWLNWLADL